MLRNDVQTILVQLFFKLEIVLKTSTRQVHAFFKISKNIFFIYF